MSAVPIGKWTASIEPPPARAVVTAAVTVGAEDTTSVSVALIRASRLLPDIAFAVVLSNGDHVAALSSRHPAFFKELTERTYEVTVDPADTDSSWQQLPDQMLLDLDYCGPTWMPLTVVPEGSQVS